VPTPASVQNRDEIIACIHRRAQDLRRLGVSRLGRFGSFQRDASGPDSDVDLLVEFVPGKKSFDPFMAPSFLMAEALGRPLELVMPAYLSPHLGPEILEEVEYVEIGR
jgi:hypothetical protein